MAGRAHDCQLGHFGVDGGPAGENYPDPRNHQVSGGGGIYSQRCSGGSEVDGMYLRPSVTAKPRPSKIKLENTCGISSPGQKRLSG